jgi:hypothetical protein
MRIQRGFSQPISSGGFGARPVDMHHGRLDETFGRFYLVCTRQCVVWYVLLFISIAVVSHFISSLVTAIEATLRTHNGVVCGLLLQRTANYLETNHCATVPKPFNFLPSGLLLPAPALSTLSTRLRKNAEWRTGGGWGCCIDCITERRATSSELTASACMLFRVLVCSDAPTAASHAARFWDLLRTVTDNNKDDTNQIASVIFEQVRKLCLILFLVGALLRMLLSAGSDDRKIVRSGDSLFRGQSATTTEVKQPDMT